MCNDFIVAAGVGISRGDISLRGGLIAISSPQCNEGSEVAIFRVEGHGVISVPRVEHCFSCVTWDGSGLVERRLGVVGFSGRVDVQGLKIDGASKGTDFLSASYHPVAPCDGFPDGDWF